jgi:uncharacterized repeat protein (TIGR01451 family)
MGTAASRLARRAVPALLVGIGFTATASAQCVSLTTPGSAYTQDFDTLSSVAGTTTNSLAITGWSMTETGGGARDNELYAVDTGASNTGDTYSYGSAGTTERALGGLQSGTLIPLFGACFTNGTGSTLGSLDVAYTGEEWRLGTAARTDRMAFEYSLDATSLTTGSWAGVGALDFVTPDTATTGAKDGNTAGERAALSATIPSLAIPNGATFWIRWTDTNASGADDGLAVDDFSLTPQLGTGAATLTVNDVTLVEGDAGPATFTFTVSLSAPAGAGGVTFDVATQDGTATVADGDYLAKSLTGQTIPEGSSTYAFAVVVNGDTTVESNETFFVNVTNVNGALAGDAQGLGTITNDDVVLTPIHDIQGVGASSPVTGASVTTRGVVTGVKPNGFFIQEPDAGADADPATSEGVYVFTSSTPPPAAAVGNLVQVTGTVAEFVPPADPLQPPLTEITAPTVSIVTTGAPLPAAVSLSASFPDPAGPVDQLERLEGMRVQVPSLTVVGPTGGTVAEATASATTNGVFYGVVTGTARPFREPGIPANDPPPAGTIPPIPRFDANPERIRVDSDGQVGAAALDVAAGATVAGLVGPLDYGFRTYTVLPDPASPPVVSGGASAVAVSTPAADEVTVASFNLQRFFDSVDDPGISEPVLGAAAFDTRLQKASLAIRDFLKTPDILAVQEVEHLTALQALAARVSSDAVAAGQPDPEYAAHLVEGNDVGGIDVGFLVKTAAVAGATPRVSVSALVQEGKDTLFTNPDSSTELLNDRPPLRLGAVVHRADGTSHALTVVVNHLRSLNDASSTAPGSSGWPTLGDRVRAKRLEQAESLASLVQARQAADPRERIVLLGDLNAYEFNDGLGDSLGVIQGTPAPDDETAVPGDGVDLVDPDLANLTATGAPGERYSYVYDGNTQMLDHVLANQALLSDVAAWRVEHARLGADFPETARNGSATAVRLSDHDPVVAAFRFGAPADLAVTKTDGQSQAVPGQPVTYTIVVSNAGPSAVVGAPVADATPLLTGVTWTCAGSGGGTCAASGTGSLDETVDLPAGAHVLFTLTGTVHPAAGGSLTNTVVVDRPSGWTDPNWSNNVATDVDTLTPAADLAVTKTDGRDTAPPGAPMTYTIVVSNAGPSDATAVVGDTVPVGISGATWTCAASGTATCAASGSGDIADTADLPAGTSATYTLAGTLAAVAGASVTNTATVTAAPGVTDPNPGNNAASDTDVVVPGLSYYTVTPCRAVDTRGGGAAIGGPVLQAKETRTLALAGTCGVPADAKALSLNLTATQPTTNGHLRLFVAGGPLPNTSTLNYTGGLTRAVNAIIGLNAGGEAAVYASQASGTVHVIVDVNGYFR